MLRCGRRDPSNDGNGVGFIPGNGLDRWLTMISLWNCRERADQISSRGIMTGSSITSLRVRCPGVQCPGVSPRVLNCERLPRGQQCPGVPRGQQGCPGASPRILNREAGGQPTFRDNVTPGHTFPHPGTRPRPPERRRSPTPRSGLTEAGCRAWLPEHNGLPRSVFRGSFRGSCNIS